MPCWVPMYSLAHSLAALLADEATTNKVFIGGSVAALFTFILAVFKIFAQDKVWKSLNATLQTELEECRSGREEQRIAHSCDRQEWRDDREMMQAERRADQAECDRQIGILRSELATTQGELLTLRREWHRDIWLGIDPEHRPADTVEPTTTGE